MAATHRRHWTTVNTLRTYCKKYIKHNIENIKNAIEQKVHRWRKTGEGGGWRRWRLAGLEAAQLI